MPPGCGRVVITQRSIALTTSSHDGSDRDAVPDEALLDVDAVGLDRARCRGTGGGPTPPIVPVPMTDTRVLPESWKVPSGPSHSNHGDPASSSKSAAIS